ncbi:hypothetical protein AB0I28_12450 [Phytomonospora sp. NPDC050363]|uniref:hypothetical protein n=1 Tax=Phytomonospora sp. NPDC050363 TaxID=3155642 RepID=UPI0033E5E7A6
MYKHFYEEIPAYYAVQRVWAEFDPDGETVVSLTISELPPFEYVTDPVRWAAVEVQEFRFTRSTLGEDWALKLKSHATPFKYDWFCVGDSLRKDLMEIVERAHAAE